MDFERRKIAPHPRGFSDNYTAPADVIWGACLVLEVSPAEEQNAATSRNNSNADRKERRRGDQWRR
jgi:hypothetical protein